MINNFSIAIDHRLRKSFEMSAFSSAVKDSNVDVIFTQNLEDMIDNPLQPFLMVGEDIPPKALLPQQWFFLVGKDCSQSFTNLFYIDSLEGDAARKLFKMIFRQYLSQRVVCIKEGAYDLSLALCMRAAHYYRNLIDDIQENLLADRIQSFLNLSVDFFAAHERFYSSSNEDELMVIFNDFITQHKVLDRVSLVKGDDSDRFVILDQQGYNFLPLIFDDRGDYLAYRVCSQQLPDVVAFYLFSILDVLSRFVHSMDLYRSAFARNNLWEEVFSLLSLPISLISLKGELLLHNQEFLRLNILPNQCLALADGAEFEREQLLYKVFRKEVQKNGQHLILFSFISIETANAKKSKNISSEQLGIISSSIAHELNNPLGGILAALSLLELEDFWDSDAQIELKEMKNSAERCKNLVQIFLGFSKTSQSLHSKKGLRFETAFEQALQLVRFRMIESNRYFMINNIETGSIYQREFDTSAVSMVFYLILSELLTSFSHHQLVAGKESGQIIIAIAQYEDRVEIEFMDNLAISERINQSKLISQLVDIEGMSLYVDESRIIFQ